MQGSVCRAGLALLAMFSLVGCSTIDAFMFKPAEASGAAKGKTALLLYGPELPDPTGVPSALQAAIGQRSDLGDHIAKRCRMERQGSPAAGGLFKPYLTEAAIPIVASLAAAGFNILADARQRRIEGIVEASQATYTWSAVLSPKQLLRSRCAVLLRYTEDKAVELNLVAVLELHMHELTSMGTNVAFTMAPGYVWMRNAVAVTRKADEPTVSVSFALSLKAVVQADGQLARLQPAAEGVVTVPDVKLGAGWPPRCIDQPCKRSDLMPFPLDKGALSLSLSVAEQGRTGFNDKAALAELAAVKAALGPAIGEAVKTRLSD